LLNKTPTKTNIPIPISFPSPKEEFNTPSMAESAYREVYPDAPLSIYLLELIADRVTDEPRWRQTLKFWKSNGYRANSVGKMCDYYDELAVKKSGNKQPNPHKQRDSGQTTDDFLISIGARPARD
jgi:hypothetical protein